MLLFVFFSHYIDFIFYSLLKIFAQLAVSLLGIEGAHDFVFPSLVFEGRFGFVFRNGIASFQNQHFPTVSVRSYSRSVSRNKQVQSPSQTQAFAQDSIQSSIFFFFFFFSTQSPLKCPLRCIGWVWNNLDLSSRRKKAEVKPLSLSQHELEL